MNENNIHISGDDARVLMVAMISSTGQVPCGNAIQLYIKLANLSNVQPKAEQ